MKKINIDITNKSKTDIAYELLKLESGAYDFYNLWDNVKELVSVNMDDIEKEELNNKISIFYTNLTMDGRFVNVGQNKWDLRERLSFDEIVKDVFDSDDNNDTLIEDEDETNYQQNEDDESFDDSTGSDSVVQNYRDSKEEEDNENN